MLNSALLQQQLKPALQLAAHDAFLSTFMNGLRNEDALNEAERISTEFADRFSTIASSQLSTIIDGYIRSADINLSLCPTPQNLIVTAAGASGPVTGSAIGSLTGIISKGLL